MTARELAELAAVSDLDTSIVAGGRMPHPADVQRRQFAAMLRQEALLSEIRDLLAGGAAKAKAKG